MVSDIYVIQLDKTVNINSTRTWGLAETAAMIHAAARKYFMLRVALLAASGRTMA